MIIYVQSHLKYACHRYTCSVLARRFRLLLIFMKNAKIASPRAIFFQISLQGSPQEFLPAGEKAGEACQWAGGPGALPRKILDFYLLKTRF